MKFYGINMLGRFLVEKVSAAPDWDNIYEGRIIYIQNSKELYYGLNDRWQKVGDVPSGEIILFEKDTAVSGYTLLTNVDDQTVFITKGSATGGETGGTLKSGSTWTQPNHIHNVGAHTHTTGDHRLAIGEMPEHDHLSVGVCVYGAGYQCQGIDSLRNNYKRTGFERTYKTGNSLPHNHGPTGYSSGDTAGSSTANTWRPKGRNFTRQQKM